MNPEIQSKLDLLSKLLKQQEELSITIDALKSEAREYLQQRNLKKLETNGIRVYTRAGGQRVILEKEHYEEAIVAGFAKSIQLPDSVVVQLIKEKKGDKVES